MGEKESLRRKSNEDLYQILIGCIKSGNQKTEIVVEEILAERQGGNLVEQDASIGVAR
jgi:hypothetical protein